MLTVRWQSHKNVLLRLKAWHTELDTYTQYIHMIAHKQRVHTLKGAQNNGAGCAKVQCPTRTRDRK